MSPQAMTFKATSMNLMDAVGTAGGIRQKLPMARRCT